MTNLIEQARKILKNIDASNADYRCYVALSEYDKNKIVEENREIIEAPGSSIVIIKVYE